MSTDEKLEALWTDVQSLFDAVEELQRTLPSGSGKERLADFLRQRLGKTE